jgi:hypothetical protein
MRGRWQRPQAGPRAGASLVGRAGLISKFDQVHGAILERLERVRPGGWALAMHYPTRWDRRLRRPCAWRTSSAIRLTTFGIADTSWGPPSKNPSSYL